MKKQITFILVFFIESVVTGQQTGGIDSVLNIINGNVSDIRKEIVKDKPEPFTGQSIFEDRKGQSAIFLPHGGTFRFDSSDASLKLSFAHKISNRKLYYGFDLSGKTNDGLMSLFSKGNISPGVKFNGYLGIQELFKSSKLLDGWINWKIGNEVSSFNLFNPDLAFSDQVQDELFYGYSTSLAFNTKIGGNKLIAISLGYQKSNNYEDLDEIELSDLISITDPISGVTRSYQTKSNARMGDYETYNDIPINLDFFWTPGKMPRIGFYHYWRTTLRDGKSKNGFGSGLYLLKKNNPLSANAGIVFEAADISKLGEEPAKNFTVIIVLAYNFKFAQ